MTRIWARERRQSSLTDGGVSEWPKERASKARAERSSAGGSNPPATASKAPVLQWNAGLFRV